MNRVAVVGPGAIGCVVAAGLVEAGHAPLIAARTTFAELRVSHPDGEVAHAVDVRSDPAGLTPVDDVLLCVKAHQTEGASAWLDALVGEATSVHVLQNGVEHVERLQAFVPGGTSIVPVIINLPAERSAPGVSAVGGRSNLTVPTGPGGEHLAQLFHGSFVNVKVTESWGEAAWTKLMMNAALGGLCTLTRTDNRVFGTDPELADLAMRLMDEVSAVAAAEGVTLSPELPSVIIDRLLRVAAGHRSSIVVDRINGVPTEFDARNAVVGRIGRRHGIETPLNDLLTTLIRAGEPGAGARHSPA